MLKRVNDHRCQLPKYHHTVKHAIALLKWWADSQAGEAPDHEIVKQSVECARELTKAIGYCQRSLDSQARKEIASSRGSEKDTSTPSGGVSGG